MTNKKDKKRRSGTATSFALAGVVAGKQVRDIRQQLNVRVSDKDWETIQVLYTLTDGDKSRNRAIVDILIPALEATLTEYPEDLVKRARTLVRSQAKLQAGIAELKNDGAPKKKR